jgi:MFS family permease
VTLAGGFMVLLDVTIVTVAVPSIQRGLGASASGVQWVVSGYPLMFGLVLVAGGRLGDALGRRRVYLIALTGFVVTSALCGAAPTLLFLIIARLLQGIAGGLITPQNAGLIQDLFRGADRGRAFGMLGATIGLSTAVGPVLGGAILDAFGEPDGWRWVFLVNVPVGLLTLVLAARLVPRVERRPGGRTSTWWARCCSGSRCCACCFRSCSRKAAACGGSGGCSRWPSRWGWRSCVGSGGGWPGSGRPCWTPGCSRRFGATRRER